ncbi:GyrI-like domain-containing protein [Carboxydochorda subterranea]|uniref:GyrI-like domain-containing protein n=1 Tax=Carboxydichorda subterranea TaxID=3109565 RepID=A0ABZ1C1M2_9FIRM|nr:GyrI-like domain-containing protein [Limnochorda sp. L945t]WRP18691.1 GyrI-like domain-containing protein [Limnochorda sp. L945t]
MASLSRRAGCAPPVGSIQQYDVQVEEVRPVTAMMVRKVGAVREAGPRVAAVMAYLVQQGRRPDGPPVAVYFDEEFDPERTDFAAGWPVGQPLPRGDSPAGPVEVLTLPGKRVAWVKHVGPYGELGDAYRALLDHIKASGLRVTGPPREWYLTDPASTPDPSQHVTRVEFPVG